MSKKEKVRFLDVFSSLDRSVNHWVKKSTFLDYNITLNSMRFCNKSKKRSRGLNCPRLCGEVSWQWPIVVYAVSGSNEDPLVFKTFDRAVKLNPDALPLCHRDRGCQCSNRTFHQKLLQAGMIQSMSRASHCIDNGPMEGFRGILKRERYYGRRFTSKQELVQMIVSFIRYYNTSRVQRNLGVLTSMEKQALCLAA